MKEDCDCSLVENVQSAFPNFPSQNFHVPQAYCSENCKETEKKYPNQKIAKKQKKNVQIKKRFKLSFLILRSALLCIRGSHSISKDSVVKTRLDDVLLTSSADLF